MGFLHSMICRTDGIRSTAPVQWRSYDGMCGVYWQAQGQTGATGYYRSPDPRIMLFFNDVSQTIRLSQTAAQMPRDWRPMLRALYVPAGLPMWTRFAAPHAFSHLDLHLDQSWLMARLGPILTPALALDALRLPVEVQDVGALAAVAQALTQEIIAPSRGQHFAQSLAVALVSGVVEVSRPQPEREPRPAAVPAAESGGLSPYQMRQLRQRLAQGRGARISNSTLAAAVGLSEGWFCRAFKKTTGKTPLHWQQEQRIAMVKQALLRDDLSVAQIASEFDFSDQGHLTRVFRKFEGTTPAAWRRAQRSVRTRP